MSAELAAFINDELAAMRRMADELIERTRNFDEKPPDMWDLNAAGGMLQSFYTGVEGTLRAIAECAGEAVDKTGSWHSELLTGMTRPTSRRPAVLSVELAERLREYLGFRHVVRSHYGFELEWERMSPLVAELDAVLIDLDSEIRRFFGA